MADNFLEKHYEDYERRKAEWLRRKRHLPRKAVKPRSPRTRRSEYGKAIKRRYKKTKNAAYKTDAHMMS